METDRPKTILCIDDQLSMVEILRWRLEKEGFRVLTASDNDEALALMREHRGEIDLVIQDGMRPPGECLKDSDAPVFGASIEFYRRFVQRELPGVPGIFWAIRNDEDFLRDVSSFPNACYVGKGTSDLRDVVAIIRSRIDEKVRIYEAPLVDNQIPLVTLNFAEVNGELIAYLARHPEYLHELHPRKFEELVAKLLEDAGFSVTLTPQTRDGGKDIYALYNTRIGHMLALVECKRYSKTTPVGVEVVRSLYGVKVAERANMGVVVTTSSFTRDARAFQQQVGYELSLRDYTDLAGWLRKYQEDPQTALSLLDHAAQTHKGAAVRPTIASNTTARKPRRG